MWTGVLKGKEVKMFEEIKATIFQIWWKPYTQMQEARQSLEYKKYEGHHIKALANQIAQKQW